METPIKKEIVDGLVAELGIKDFAKATIREVKQVAAKSEMASGVEFIKMEMGIPGLPAAQVGVDAQIKALEDGIAHSYPDIQGAPVLKQAASQFVKAFIGIDIKPEGCVPVSGSMQGTFASFLTCSQCDKKKDTVLFIDPGFPVQKMQLQVMGVKYETFDVYDYRGDKLGAKLESYLSKGNICAIVYSNPNNPSWICLREEELQVIGTLATKYDAIVMEDLAYFAMDFRKDLSHPGQPPYQSTVAQYTNRWLMLISSSKAFSYAGQRIGCMVVSNELYTQRFPDLLRYFSSDIFGRALIYGALYPLSSGVAHSVQYGMAAMLKAANEGEFNFVDQTREYGEKAKIMKRLFTENGFEIVYNMDEDKPLADGFYFTIAYPGLSGEQLIEELLYYGVSAIALSTTGSERTEGLRACVSQVSRDQFPALEERLKAFRANHPL